MSRLKKVEFECEVITPMFLGGADGNEAELRASSIRGALRFWFRAMQTDIQSENELYDRESIIFGTSDETVQKRLKIIDKLNIQLLQIDGLNLSNEFWLDNALKTPRFNKDDKRLIGDNMGLNFLYYSTITSKKFFIKTGNRFEVIFTSLNDDIVFEASKSFLVLSLLGGLGSRARRTAGAFTINRVNSTSDNLKDKVEQFKNEIKKNLSKITKTESDTTTYSSLVNTDIFVSNKTFQNWYDAVYEVGLQYEKFRFKNRSRIFETPVLGSPVMHNKKSYSAALLTNTNKIEEFERRSSPICISIYKTEDGYRWIVTFLNGELFPMNARIGKIKDKMDRLQPDSFAKKTETVKDNILYEPIFSDYIHLSELNK